MPSVPPLPHQMVIGQMQADGRVVVEPQFARWLTDTRDTVNEASSATTGEAEAPPVPVTYGNLTRY